MNNIIIVSILTGIFIYNRKLDYYKVIPRENIIAAGIISLWTYISFKYSVWFIIVGLLVLNILDKFN